MLKRCVLINRPMNTYKIKNGSSRSSSTQTSTIDSNEVLHFKKYSSTWWDEMGEMKPLHSMNKLRVPFIRNCLINSGKIKSENINTPNVLQGLNLLDVGCGGGLLTEPLARLGCKVTGVDATSELIEIAQRHAADDKSLCNLTYLTSSIEDISDKNAGLYDAVIASEIIEHVNDKSTFIAECVKCIKPGGSLFLTTINKTFVSRIGAICIPEYVLEFIPKGTHEYTKFVEPHVIQRLLEDNNCTTKLVHGMFYNYFTNNWSWMKDTSICYALHATKS